MHTLCFECALRMSEDPIFYSEWDVPEQTGQTCPECGADSPYDLSDVEFATDQGAAPATIREALG